MRSKNKKTLLFKRVLIWAIYLFSGYLLYSKKTYLYSFFITFAKIIYPLSIFWLQIRIKTKAKLLPINSSMTTSQLWFNLLPILASLITIILSLLNTLFYVKDKLIQVYISYLSQFIKIYNQFCLRYKTLCKDNCLFITIA